MDDRQIIGRLKAVPVSVASVGMVGALGCFGYFWYLRLNGRLHSMSVTWMASAGIVLIFSRVPLYARMWRQILSDDRNAVWLRDGKLEFLQSGMFSVRCTDVADIHSDEDIYGYPEVGFVMRDGRKTKFSLYYVDQKPDVIVERMRALCGLPQSAGEGSKTTVIARGAWHRAIAGLILLAIAAGLAFWLGAGQGGSATTILAILAALAAVASLWLIVHAVLHSVSSIWIAKRTLHLNWRDQAPLDQVQDALFQESGARSRIMVRLRDGRAIYSAPVNTFTEPAPDVLARLRQALGLPQA